MKITEIRDKMRKSSPSLSVFAQPKGQLRITQRDLQRHAQEIETGEQQMVVFYNYLWPVSQNLWQERLVTLEKEPDKLVFRSDLYMDCGILRVVLGREDVRVIVSPGVQNDYLQ